MSKKLDLSAWNEFFKNVLFKNKKQCNRSTNKTTRTNYSSLFHLLQLNREFESKPQTTDMHMSLHCSQVNQGFVFSLLKANIEFLQK